MMFGIGLDGPCTTGPGTNDVGPGRELITVAALIDEEDTVLLRVLDEEELLDDELEEEDELELRLPLPRLVAANAGLAVVSMSPAMNAAARNDFAVVFIRYL